MKKTIPTDPLKAQARAYMKKHSLTRSEFARRAGVYRWSIVRWLSRPDANLGYVNRQKITRLIIT